MKYCPLAGETLQTGVFPVGPVGARTAADELTPLDAAALDEAEEEAEDDEAEGVGEFIGKE